MAILDLTAMAFVNRIDSHVQVSLIPRPIIFRIGQTASETTKPETDDKPR
jgi:hypothetical protein